MVDVQERALGPLEQEPLAVGDGAMEPGGRVADVRPQALGQAEVLVGDLARVERREVGQHRGEQAVLVVDDPAEVLAELLGVEQVADADAVHAPDLNSLGFALVGGRLVAGNEQPTALFVYENTDYSLEFFLTAKEFNERLMDNPDYAELLEEEDH